MNPLLLFAGLLISLCFGLGTLAAFRWALAYANEEDDWKTYASETCIWSAIGGSLLFIVGLPT